MKFLCENCKAKYQIGDDKVAGKTVRMKCRRCGHLIEVSASVTASSVAQAPPTEAPAQPARAPSVAPAPSPVRVAEAPSASLSAPSEDLGERPTAVSSPPVRLAKPPPPAPAMRAPGAPRPVTSPPAAPRPGGSGVPPAPRPVTSLRPVPSARPSGSVAVARPAEQAPIRAVDSPLELAPPRSQNVQAAGVAGAFTRAIAEPVSQTAPRSSLSSSRPTPSEDWYVGVGGVPLGPIRLAVIREKAAAGTVDGDSLVWREGFDEWQPLKNFRELLQLVTEAQASRLAGRRPSGMHSAVSSPSAPQAMAAKAAASASAPASTPAPETPSRAALHAETTEPAPATPSERSRASTGSLGDLNLLAALSPVAGSSARPSDVSSAAAAGPPPKESVVAAQAAEVAAAVVVAPVPAPEPATPSQSTTPYRQVAGISSPAPEIPVIDAPADSFEVPRRRRRGMHPMAYAFIGMASLFGMTAAYVLLARPHPQIVYVPGETVVIHDQAAPPPSATGSPGGSAPDPTSAPTVKSAGGGVRSAPDARTAAPVAPSSGSGMPDLSGFGNGGVAGPSAQGPSGTQGNTATGELTASDISSVVSRNQTIIQRKCWQQALESRTKEGAANAKVNVKIMIGPSGDVQSATASGGDAFPGLADCIAGRIKGWKFPPSGGSTPVSVPFVFAGQ